MLTWETTFKAFLVYVNSLVRIQYDTFTVWNLVKDFLIFYNLLFLIYCERGGDGCERFGKKQDSVIKIAPQNVYIFNLNNFLKAISLKLSGELAWFCLEVFGD